MTLKEYIEELQKILETEGDLPLYTAADPEGNSYFRAEYLPEIRVVPKDELEYDRVEYLHEPFKPDENTWEDYCDEYGVDEELDPSDLTRVILL